MTFLLSRQAQLIVNIVDASNIERNLYLTSQLLEMRVPLIIALNMMDMALERQLQIDVEGLEQRLGCPCSADDRLEKSWDQGTQGDDSQQQCNTAADRSQGNVSGSS